MLPAVRFELPDIGRALLVDATCVGTNQNAAHVVSGAMSDHPLVKMCTVIHKTAGCNYMQ